MCFESLHHSKSLLDMLCYIVNFASYISSNIIIARWENHSLNLCTIFFYEYVLYINIIVASHLVGNIGIQLSNMCVAHKISA